MIVFSFILQTFPVPLSVPSAVLLQRWKMNSTGQRPLLPPHVEATFQRHLFKLLTQCMQQAGSNSDYRISNKPSCLSFGLKPTLYN